MRFIVQIVLSVIAVCIVHAGSDSDIFGGLANRALIMNAQEVSICAMKVDWDATRDQGRGVMFPEGVTRRLPTDLLEPFTALLLSPSTYPKLEGEKECIPSYHIRARFQRESETLDVSFCFGCDILQFHKGTHVISEVDFDTGADELFAILFRVFPDDTTMRFLNERRTAWRQKKSEANQPGQHNAGSRSSLGDSPDSETPSARAPRG